MEIGLYGLGRMGGNMVTRLVRGGHRVVAGNRSAGPVDEAKSGGAIGAYTIEDMAKQLRPPRVLWSMVPAGEATDHTLDEFAKYASKGDVLVDGANSYFRDSMRRAEKYKAMGFEYLDVGVSGGVWGLENGYCMMVGGDAPAVERVKPVLDTLAPPNGWAHFGKSGAGHFVKMVHNGIEYGMMQAYGEGFELIHASDFKIDMKRVATVWMQGSVVRSWLLDLTADFLREDAELANIAPLVADSGEGRWTVAEAVEQGVPAPVLSLALMMRFASQGKGEYADRMLAMMRKGFGGHKVASAERDDA
jgi:6-phosphogluconate dehydrogenase